MYCGYYGVYYCLKTMHKLMNKSVQGSTYTALIIITRQKGCPKIYFSRIFDLVNSINTKNLFVWGEFLNLSIICIYVAEIF